MSLINIGKAGRSRWMGKRPEVRGVVMNPNDHPHGGGEGRAPIGRKSPMSPWGKPTLGYKTRKKKKASSKYIVRRPHEVIGALAPLRDASADRVNSYAA